MSTVNNSSRMLLLGILGQEAALRLLAGRDRTLPSAMAPVAAQPEIKPQPDSVMAKEPRALDGSKYGQLAIERAEAKRRRRAQRKI